jgi:hypothetical protein
MGKCAKQDKFAQQKINEKNTFLVLTNSKKRFFKNFNKDADLN